MITTKGELLCQPEKRAGTVVILLGSKGGVLEETDYAMHMIITAILTVRMLKGAQGTKLNDLTGGFMLTDKQKKSAERVFNELAKISKEEFKKALEEHGEKPEVQQLVEFLESGERFIFGDSLDCEQLPIDSFKDAAGRQE